MAFVFCLKLPFVLALCAESSSFVSSRTHNILKIQRERSNKCKATVTANPCSYELQYIKMYDILYQWGNIVKTGRKKSSQRKI